MTQEADMNREHFEFEKSVRLNVANETRKEQRVQVSWALRNAKAEIIYDGGTKEFEVPALFRYEDPNLSYRIEGEEIVVSADAYAKSVEIQNAAEDFVLSDNYFDINGDEKRVKIISGEAKGIRLKSVYNIR